MKRKLYEDMALKSDLIKFHLLDKNSKKIIDEKKVLKFLDQLGLEGLYNESKCIENYLIKTKTYKIINPSCYINLFSKIQEDENLKGLLKPIVEETKIEIADIIIKELDKKQFSKIDEGRRELYFSNYIEEVKVFILKELLGEVDKNNDLEIHPTEERINIVYDALNAFIKLDGWEYIESRYSG